MDKNIGGEALARAVEAAYASGQTDYYLEPLAQVDENGAPVGKIKDGDAVVFCCRRGSGRSSSPRLSPTLSSPTSSGTTWRISASSS